MLIGLSNCPVIVLYMDYLKTFFSVYYEVCGSQVNQLFYYSPLGNRLLLSDSLSNCQKEAIVSITIVDRQSPITHLN